MGNQELFDSYATKIAEQNSQIKAAFAVIISEIGKLQAAAEAPLDTSKMDAAIQQLTAAVDEVESIPTPVGEPAPVEEAPAPAEEPAPVEADPVSEDEETPEDE